MLSGQPLGNVNLRDDAVRAAISAGDPTALLMAEHEWIRSVLREVRTLLAMLPDDRRLILTEQVQDLGVEIDLHIRKEEEVYFPAIEPLLQEAGQDSTLDLYGEHDAIRIRLGRFIEALAENRDIVGSFNEFSRSLTIHFANEEELVLEAAPERLSEATSRSLAHEMQALPRH